MEKEMNGLLDQLEAKLSTTASAMKAIYQVEGTVKKDPAGNVTHLEWVDVSLEDAKRAWSEFGLLVRTVYIKDASERPLETLNKTGASLAGEVEKTAQQPAQAQFSPSVNEALKVQSFFVVDMHKLAEILGHIYSFALEPGESSLLDIYDTNDDQDYVFTVEGLENTPAYRQADVIKALGEIGKSRTVSIYKLGYVLDHASQMGAIPTGKYLVRG